MEETRILRLLIPGLMPKEIQRWAVLATVPGRVMLPGVQARMVQSFAGKRVFEQEVRIVGYGARSLRSRVQLNGLSVRFDYLGVLQPNQPKGEPVPVFQ